MVGNEFGLASPHRPLTQPVVQPQLVLPPIVPAMPVVPITASRQHPLSQLFEAAHRHSLSVFALLFLLVGTAGIQVGASYWSAHILDGLKPASTTIKLPTSKIAGLNITVPASQLPTRLASITGQPASLTVGSQTVAISPNTIKSWVQVTASTDKSQDYLSVKTASITSSLQSIANQFVKAPVNQVTATYADGSTSVIAPGVNGVALSDPGGLKTQAAAIAKTLMNGNGLQFNAPTTSQAFADITPASFDKSLDVNVTTHVMVARQGNQIVNTFLVTAGAPDTPTPIGTFHIWEKLPLQTMTGFNPNGTKYVQPNVPWINYFDHSGDAVHGNYWRPASVFGSVNTSHGCVGVQVADAEWIYNWAPIGTTVITHT